MNFVDMQFLTCWGFIILNVNFVSTLTDTHSALTPSGSSPRCHEIDLQRCKTVAWIFISHLSCFEYIQKWSCDFCKLLCTVVGEFLVFLNCTVWNMLIINIHFQIKPDTSKQICFLRGGRGLWELTNVRDEVKPRTSSCLTVRVFRELRDGNTWRDVLILSVVPDTLSSLVQSCSNTTDYWLWLCSITWSLRSLANKVAEYKSFSFKINEKQSVWLFWGEIVFFLIEIWKTEAFFSSFGHTPLQLETEGFYLFIYKAPIGLLHPWITLPSLIRATLKWSSGVIRLCRCQVFLIVKVKL